MTCLAKLEPGASLPIHIHPEIEQALVLEGSMTDHDGTVRAGEYVWRHGGSVHENYSDEGAVVFARLSQAQYLSTFQRLTERTEDNRLVGIS